MRSVCLYQTIDTRRFVDIDLPPTCHAEDDKPITRFEDDEDEVFFGFDNTVEAHVPSPDGLGEDGDISSVPDDTAPNTDFSIYEDDFVSLMSEDLTVRNPQQTVSENGEEDEPGAWSSDYSNSEDEDTESGSRCNSEEFELAEGGRYVALADYCAMGQGEVSMKESDVVELFKVGCAGWWYIKVASTQAEGWAPSAYLEPAIKKIRQ
uniref:(California timema) hypothetical protein n=1 Tax=Timema californicum TaxID=61474 RepID=A0A7R9P636_TIMCA|nr:unnamed protein product [Timema californicum]